MPIYLLHGFRWRRELIRIHIILQDLEDAAPDWIMAPATSISMLNSFYSLYDFLPASNPPPLSYPFPTAQPLPTIQPPPTPPAPVVPELLPERPKTLTKVNKGSTRSLRSLGRKSRPPNIEAPPPLPSPSLSSSLSPATGMGLRSMKNENNLPTNHRTGNGHANTSSSPNPSPSSTSTSRPVPHSASSTPTTILPIPHKSHARPSTAHTNNSTSTSTPQTTKRNERFNDWSVVKLLEQYDPDDLTSASQPFAYVADYMVEVRLGTSVEEERGRYESWRQGEEEGCFVASSADRTRHKSMDSTGTVVNGQGQGHKSPTTNTSVSSVTGANGEAAAGTGEAMLSPSLSVREAKRSRRIGWFEQLRDGLQGGSEIGWFVVFCGDEERFVPGSRGKVDEDEDDEFGDEDEVERERERGARTPRSAGFRNMFSRRKSGAE